MNIEILKVKALRGEKLTQSEGEWLISEANEEELFEAASEITRRCAARKFDMCSIVNARSGRCSENCAWCAQSAHFSTGVECYELLSKEECLRHAKYNEEQGVARFSLVTSGRRCRGKEVEKLEEISAYLSEKTDLQLCASLGLMLKEDLAKLYARGIKRYHCNLETAPSYFSALCTTHTMEEKIATLRAAREVGMKLCSGGIISMGESAEQRVEFALTLRELEVDSVPLNILQPIKGTPLEKTERLSDTEILRTVALFRFVHPTAYLRFAGGRSSLGEATLRKAMEIGVNAAIVGDLLTTIGSTVSEDKEIIKEVGYEL